MRVKNRGLLYNIAKSRAYGITNKTNNIEVDIPKETLEVMLSDSRKIYSGLHKSMWETLGLPTTINSRNVKVPYVVVANTLVGWPFKFIAEYIGLIFVDTKNKKQGIIDMKKKVPPVLQKGIDIMIFPEGTRTKTGLIGEFSAPIFEIAKNHSKIEETYIIPFNDDYQFVNDAQNKITSTKKYKFMIHHIADWNRDLKNIYVSFGEPIKVRDFKDRKKLNSYTKEKTIELVKILPVNIFAEAMKRLGTHINENILGKEIEKIIKELEPHKEKFRGFTKTEEIFSNISIGMNEHPEIYQLYSGYIAHYFPK